MRPDVASSFATIVASSARIAATSSTPRSFLHQPDEARHVRALLRLRQVHVDRSTCRRSCCSVPSVVAHGQRMPHALDADALDREMAQVGRSLDVGQVVREGLQRFGSVHDGSAAAPREAWDGDGAGAVVRARRYPLLTTSRGSRESSTAARLDKCGERARAIDAAMPVASRPHAGQQQRRVAVVDKSVRQAEMQDGTHDRRVGQRLGARRTRAAHDRTLLHRHDEFVTLRELGAAVRRRAA